MSKCSFCGRNVDRRGIPFTFCDDCLYIVKKCKEEGIGVRELIIKEYQNEQYLLRKCKETE